MSHLAKVVPGLFFAITALVSLSGCGLDSKQSSQAQPTNLKNSADPKPIAVDVAIAKLEQLDTDAQFIGTTAPIREVSIRSRTEGQLVSLNVDVGDVVTQGQVLGQQDRGVLEANVLEAEAELAARESEVSRTKTQVNNAKTLVERSRLELLQAQSDAQRLKQLSISGAVTKQAAEQSQTRADTAKQALRSAQQEVQSRQNEVASAQKRVQAQRAVIDQARERLDYTTLSAPTAGVVLQKVTEAGNLLQPGNEVVRLADFSQLKVRVEISELNRSNISLGQGAEIVLDAFPGKTFSGQISRISPGADPVSRLIPVEVTLPNTPESMGSGLLARVRFARTNTPSVVATQSALRVGGRASSSKDQLFILSRSGEESTVVARRVKIGAQADGKVTIVSGLKPGESYITRSSRPLKQGDKVVLSALSEGK